MTLNEMRDEAHQNAKDHGWHDEKVHPLAVHALIHSEISEATEEVRNGMDMYIGLEGKPEGEAVELADAVIRHGQDSHIVVMAHGQANAEIRDDGQAATLTCNHESPILAFPGRTAAAYGSTVRRLTLMECERLQGFPDNWTRIPWRGKPAENCPDAPRYKACGNSMAVPVMRWIGTRIKEVE